MSQQQWNEQEDGTFDREAIPQKKSKFFSKRRKKEENIIQVAPIVVIKTRPLWYVFFVSFWAIMSFIIGVVSIFQQFHQTQFGWGVFITLLFIFVMYITRSFQTKNRIAVSALVTGVCCLAIGLGGIQFWYLVIVSFILNVIGLLNQVYKSQMTKLEVTKVDLVYTRYPFFFFSKRQIWPLHSVDSVFSSQNPLEKLISKIVRVDIGDLVIRNRSGQTDKIDDVANLTTVETTLRNYLSPSDGK